MIVRPYDIEKAGKAKQDDKQRQPKTTKDEGDTVSSQGGEKVAPKSKHDKSANKSAVKNLLTEDYEAVSKPTTKLYLYEHEGTGIDHKQSNLSFKIKMNDLLIGKGIYLNTQLAT